jgi:transposase
MASPREAELLKIVEAQQRRLEEQDREIKILRQKIDALARRVFGKSSEKLDKDQLELLLAFERGAIDLGKSMASSALEEEAAAHRKLQESRRRRCERKERWPADLPVVEEVLDPDEVKQAPEQWRLIGQEISEQLDFEPAKFCVRRLVRRKYVQRKSSDQAVPVIAPLPPGLQERCAAAPGLIAQIIVGKYCDHLPLYRQESIFATRHNIDLPRQSQARYVELAADWLQPVYEMIRTGVMGGGYVQVDETPVRYLAPGNGQTKQGYLWTAHRPRGDTIFHWEPGRGADCLERIIPIDFRGVLQSDAYSAYKRYAAERALTLAGCLAHLRRKFWEAREQAPQQALFILRLIQHLYAVEAELRRQAAGPALRLAVRTSHSLPAHERLYRVLVRLKGTGRYLPSTAFAQAIDYGLSNWELLRVYLSDGRVEIDNNLVENAIRPTAIGKKNWLFFGDAAAGKRSAILYTIIESCRRWGIDPYAYLRDVLTRLPSMTNHQVKDITPEAWAKAHGHQRLPKAA